MTLLDATLAAHARHIHTCDHDGLHTPMARYSRGDGVMRYVTVCDGCGTETAEVRREAYAPRFDPHGNDPYTSIAAVAG